jgi:hypothetical protein
MPANYKNGIIYKIVNNIDDMIYIGSTTTKLCYRMAVHRCKMRNNYNATLYQHMRKIGIHNFTIVLIEDYPCQNKMQLLRRERYYFELYDKQILLNTNRPIITRVEKKQGNNKYCKFWHANNKNYHNNQIKLWFIKNKLYRKIYIQKYKEYQKIMQELPFYRVPLTISF